MGIDWNTTLAEVMEKGIELEVVELMLKSSWKNMKKSSMKLWKKCGYTSN